MDHGHLGHLGQPAALNVSRIEGEHVQTLLLESQMEDIVLEGTFKVKIVLMGTAKVIY